MSPAFFLFLNSFLPNNFQYMKIFLLPGLQVLPFKNNITAFFTAFRSQINYPVSAFNYFLVMLDKQYRMTVINKKQFSDLSNLFISWKCKPVVGSSKMKVYVRFLFPDWEICKLNPLTFPPEVYSTIAHFLRTPALHSDKVSAYLQFSFSFFRVDCQKNQVLSSIVISSMS